MTLLMHTCTHAAVAVSFVLRTYNVTEGIGLQFVEVCVQVVLGSLDSNAMVDLWAVSQTATGNVITSFVSFRLSA